MVHEWSVMATDWLLAAVCLWFEHILRQCPIRAHAQRAVAAGFAATAVAAIIGGLRHGMGPWLSDDIAAVLWFFSYAPIALAGSFLLWGVLRAHVRDTDARSQYSALIGIKCLIAVGLLLFGHEAGWVAASYAADTFVIGAVGIISAGRWWVRGMGRWLLLGAAISVAAGIVQLGWPFGTHGTLHNDAFHLLMIPAIWAYARAARLFPEVPIAPSRH